ncbi:hypothetical protein N665_0482s0050 [Sinapis alba]|nr:hypothetical protein N665_0482s0050 [Sinapis alba]
MDSNECSFLPLELCEQILCRVPTKSLIRFKLTCKRWLSLFNDKRFINKHLALIDEHFIRINHYRKVTIINPMTRACSSFSLPHEFQAKPDIYTMIHCDGLLLCILESAAMAVWNPCLNQVRWIKAESYYPYYSLVAGIGYNGLSRDGGYKILRFGGSAYSRYQHTNTVVDIYELKSNSWKKYEVSLDWHVVTPCRGVSLMGNMYWIAKWNQSGFFIQSFNFSTETFERVASLPFDYDASDDVVNLSAFRGNHLSLSQHNKETEKIDVWVTNMVNNRVSWTKFFSVTRPDCPVFRASDDIATQVHFIDKNNKVVVCCEEVAVDERYVSVNIYLFGEGEIKKQEIELHKRGFSWPCIPGYAYLPSLVPVLT